MIKEVSAFSSGYRLKGIKSMMGNEGIAWSAKLYKDGKALGDVIDEGNGGAMRIRISSEQLKALQAVAREKVGGECESDAIFLSALADYTNAIARMKRKNSKSPVAICDDELDEYGIPVAYSQFKCATTAANLLEIKRRFPEKRLFSDELALW